MTSPKRFALVFVLIVLIYVRPTSAGPIFDFTGSSGTGGVNAARQGTVGWSFTLLVPMTVDGLGVWDENGYGIYIPQTVGLWTSDGTLLSSAIVDGLSTATSSSSSAGQWLFTSVTAFVLDPGDYVLGALYSKSSVLSSDGVHSIPGTPAMHLETLHADPSPGDVEADVFIRAVKQLDTSSLVSDAGILGEAVVVSGEGDPQRPTSTPTFTTLAGVTYTGSRAEAGDTLTFPTDSIANGFGANLSVQAVPEPLTVVLLGAGLAGCIARRYSARAFGARSLPAKTDSQFAAR